MKNIRINFLNVDIGFGLAAGNFTSSKGYGNREFTFPKSVFKAIDQFLFGTLKTISIRNCKGFPAATAVPGFEKPNPFLKKPKNHEKKYFFHQSLIVFSMP
jgi:hypothetical protein